MGLTGSLETMALPELLQWIQMARKSGALYFCRERTTVTFLLEDGAICGCAGDEPATLLGQFLVARGRIDERQLEEALVEQTRSGRPLGQILIDRELLGPNELERYVKAKAEETLFSLFSWNDAHFEFSTTAGLPPNVVRFRIDLQEVLFRGAQRQDDMSRMRAVFPSDDLVLERTEHALHPETASAPMAARIYELVDGRRTIGEILLQSRASEHLGLTFLYELYRRGVVAVREQHATRPRPGTIESTLHAINEFVERRDFDGALVTVQEALARYPREERIREAARTVEDRYREAAYASDLPPDLHPIAVRPRSGVGNDSFLSANELYLLDMVEGGGWSVSSLVRIAPLHEVDVLRALRGLARKSFIELREPHEIESPESAPQADLVPLDLDPAAPTSGPAGGPAPFEDAASLELDLPAFVSSPDAAPPDDNAGERDFDIDYLDERLEDVVEDLEGFGSRRS